MYKSRPSVLMFPDANFLAHTSRLLEVSKALRDEHGCEVSFAGDGPYLDLLYEEGFPVEFCFTVPKQNTLDLARKAFLVEPVWWCRKVMRSIRSDVEVIGRRRPDVVVGDMHWSLRASSIECGVPYVSIVNAAWTNYCDFKFEAFDDHLLTAVLGRKLATRILPTFRRQALRYWAFPYKIWQVAARRAQTSFGNLLDVIAGDITLLADVPEFCPTTGLPDNFRYVGPILWKPSLRKRGWLDNLNPSRRTIYVSMGSTGDPRFSKLSIEAFAGTEYQVVMTTGEIGLTADRLPSNFFVTDFAPGLPIMQRADVSVNHGGNGTIYQALSAGVPVVGIPSHLDQQVQLQLCERIGVGRKLVQKTLTPTRLREAVGEILTRESYRKNARRMAGILGAYDGPRIAARTIFDLLQGNVRPMNRHESRPVVWGHAHNQGGQNWPSS